MAVVWERRGDVRSGELLVAEERESRVDAMSGELLVA